MSHYDVRRPARAGARAVRQNVGMSEGTMVGRLLVATPQLADPNFTRSVVLIVQHHEEGAVGVVLNRPTQVAVGEVLPRWASLVSDPTVLFRGGPVSPEGAICLGGLQAGALPPDGWRRLDDDRLESLGLVDLEAPPVMLAESIDGMRVFAGYAGWTTGQLEREIADGAWYLLPAEPADAFQTDPHVLWANVLRRQGGQLAMLATLPQDPTLN
jgi:putative transcriptional regulator